ncbi:MAG: amidohydrolase family protein [Chloroflexi bacterium]|nr:amidohydrolase family protein [Chloroflexota bacterium]
MTELGAVGVAMFQGATNGHLLTEEVFTPLWQELNRLRSPLGFHIGTGGRLRDDPGTRYRDRRRADLVRNTVAQSWAPTTLAELIMGGVLEEYPELRIAIMESNVAWLPWLLWRMDEKWERYGPDQDFTLSLKPSEYFRRQCYTVVDADEGVVRHVIEYIGDDNLLFSTDYPHHDSPFPDGVNTFLALPGLSDASKRKILWDNGARLYELPTPALGAPAGGGDSVGSDAAAR